MLDLLQAAPFQKVFPQIFVKDVEKPEQKMRRLEQKYASLHVASNIEKYGTPRVNTRLFIFVFTFLLLLSFSIQKIY